MEIAVEVPARRLGGVNVARAWRQGLPPRAVISWSPYGKHKSQKALVALMLRDAAAFLHSDGVNLTLLLKAAKFIRASL